MPEKQGKKIVIIGGVATGAKAAARARRLDPDAEILILEQGNKISYAGCGLPYFVGGGVKEIRELLSTSAGVVRNEGFFKKVKDIDVRTATRVDRINRSDKTVTATDLRTGEQLTFPYDQLVIETGGNAVMPPFEGRELRGIFKLTHPDDAEGLVELMQQRQGKKAVIVGGGLIGLETAENLAARGIDVTIIEMLDVVMGNLLDWEMAALLMKHMRAKGVQIRTGEKVIKFVGDGEGFVKQVVTDQDSYDADMAIVSVGVRPNAALAKEAGLTIGMTGAIAVNEYLQTSDPDIYAGGDCVENNHLITGKKVFAPMGSTANKHGRVIGDNITGGKETFKGVLGTAIVKVFDINVGRVGLTEREARQEGYDVVTAIAPNSDIAHFYPEAKSLIIKLVVDKKTTKVLGGQIVGPGEVAKRIDVLATALTFGADVDQLSKLDLAYAPPFAPALDPIITAANVVKNKLAGIAKTLTPMEVKEKIDRGDDFIFLDVRTQPEFEQVRIEAPQMVFLPLGQLRDEAEAKLPKEKEIVTFCKISLRGYEAQRILEGLGYSDVKFMDGGIVAWPYNYLN